MFNVHPALAGAYLAMGKELKFIERLERLHDYLVNTFLPKYNEASTDSSITLLSVAAIELDALNKFIMYDGGNKPTLWPLCNRTTPDVLLQTYTTRMNELDVNQLNLINLYNFIWSVYFPHLPMSELIGCLISNGISCDDENVQIILVRFMHQVALIEVDGLVE